MDVNIWCTVLARVPYFFQFYAMKFYLKCCNFYDLILDRSILNSFMSFYDCVKVYVHEISDFWRHTVFLWINSSKLTIINAFRNIQCKSPHRIKKPTKCTVHTVLACVSHPTLIATFALARMQKQKSVY